MKQHNCNTFSGVSKPDTLCLSLTWLTPITPCNYFGKEYYQQVQAPEIAFRQSDVLVALTTFPGYMGAMEGDNQFLSFAGPSGSGNVQVCPSGKSAKIYRDAFCFDVDGDVVCDSKNFMFMVKFPNPNTVIVGKTHSELVDELVEELIGQTGGDLDNPILYDFC